MFIEKINIFPPIFSFKMSALAYLGLFTSKKKMYGDFCIATGLDDNVEKLRKIHVFRVTSE